MGFHNNVQDAIKKIPYKGSEVCFECCGPLKGPVVSYDGYLGEGKGLTLLLHRKCAMMIASRLVLDTWPKRHAVPRMEIKEET